MSEAIEAEVVEPSANLAKAPDPAIAYTLPTVTVGNLEGVERFVAQVEAFFEGVEIDPTDPDQVKALKGLRADVNKAANAIDGKRKDMDRAVKGAMSEADGALNALRDRLREVYAKTGRQIEEADAIWLQGRTALLRHEYEGAAPDLAELIPLDAFAAKEPKLLQKSWKGPKACDKLDEMIAEAVADRKRLAESDLAHPVEADAVYCETLDLKAALDEDRRLKVAEAAKQAHLAASRQLQEHVEARRGQQAPKPEPAPQGEPEALSRWTISFTGTEPQAAEVKALMVRLGVADRKCKRSAL